MKRKVRWSRYAICLLAAITAIPVAGEPSSESSVLAGQAKASVAAFASVLKSELTAAMRSGGPVEAIEVCNSKAPAIADEISLQQDVAISRVSARNRNPANAPNDWQAAVLEEFEARKVAGEDPANLAWQGITETGAGREFRFMKAIPTAALCLACHGTELAPDVALKIAELYPADLATGYREGDLRGAFVVTKPLP